MVKFDLPSQPRLEITEDAAGLGEKATAFIVEELERDPRLFFFGSIRM